MLVLLLLLATAPGDFERLSRQATAARLDGRTEEAVRYYRASLRAQPAWSEGWWHLGTLLYDKNSFAQARDAYARLVKLEPKASTGWAFLGLCEFETKEYAKSLAHLERGIALERETDPQVGKVARYHSALLNGGTDSALNIGTS